MVRRPEGGWLAYFPALFLGASAIFTLYAGLTGQLPRVDAIFQALVAGAAAVAGLRLLPLVPRPVPGRVRAVGWVLVVGLYLARLLTESNNVRILLETASTLLLWLSLIHI